VLFRPMNAAKAARINDTLYGALVRYRTDGYYDPPGKSPEWHEGTFLGICWPGVREGPRGEVTFGIGAGTTHHIFCLWISELDVLIAEREFCENCLTWDTPDKLVTEYNEWAPDHPYTRHREPCGDDDY
jgi:hypothetical protein